MTGFLSLYKGFKVKHFPEACILQRVTWNILLVTKSTDKGFILTN